MRLEKGKDEGWKWMEELLSTNSSIQIHLDCALLLSAEGESST